MKKLTLLITLLATFILGACATQGSKNNSTGTGNGIDTYNNTPDNPMVNSRAASSEEFPQENQL